MRFLRPFWPTLKYWMEVEVHVFGFSIAANVLLSFFPFLLVLVWFCRSIGWDSAEQAVYFAMSEYDKALADFNRVILLEPRYTSAYAYLGWTHEELKEYDQAISDQ